ncbi:NAD(P)-dependent oxidoreductase [Gracilibacillus marinus]|uniref:NAD(P)-dependent oxidoreductase n=1 Tax=Gracilibacillus marinus TaxID=630535 RepID=A0ABV8VWL6_9BACI
MKLLLLGATGRVGSNLLRLALQDGHEVTALVRKPEKISITDDKLTIMEGNVVNQEDISRSINGMDMVLSALNTDGNTTLTDSMPHIIREMESEGIKRIITIGTAGILQSRNNPSIYRYQSNESKRKSTRAAEEHRKVYELLIETTLQWTIVCPTYLPDGTLTGAYRTEKTFLPEGGTNISVQDTAHFAYNQLHSDKYVQTRVGIAY